MGPKHKAAVSATASANEIMYFGMLNFGVPFPALNLQRSMMAQLVACNDDAPRPSLAQRAPSTALLITTTTTNNY